MELPLDVITIGRSSVDLYGAQVGGRLEDMRSFNKYIGGSPANIAVGAARLGLKSALITRVGDEHMGRFIREQLSGEGVDIRGVITDPERLTALVLLGIRDSDQFPLIFYRENCADMALCVDDIDRNFIAEARCITVTGTHLSHPKTEAAILKALHIARQSGARTALDIDYRPNLWGLSGHGDGENRYIKSGAVTAKLQSTLHLFDLIVGTEEEFHIAGGSRDTIQALSKVRSVTDAILVCKRGPMGAVIFEGEIPLTLDSGIGGPGFPVDIYNVLGAGDGFISGLLKGWLGGYDWKSSLKFANACGAFAVSRHGCAPAYPSWEELQYFLKEGSAETALRKDKKLSQIHWSTNRTKEWPELRIFDFGHCSQLEELADEAGVGQNSIAGFKRLCLQATKKVAQGRDGHGIVCDSQYGQEALYSASDSGLWIARPADLSVTPTLQLEEEIGPDFCSLASWPQNHVAKVQCFYHLEDSEDLKTRQEQTVTNLINACRHNTLDFLLEIVHSRNGHYDEDTTARIIQRFYDIDVFPDWWKIEPMNNDTAWQNTCLAVSRNDPYCRGIIVSSTNTPQSDLSECFNKTAKYNLVKGFSVGPTVFGSTAKEWFSGKINDTQAVDQMAENYAEICDLWDSARDKKG